jgi:hypothetical protein
LARIPRYAGDVRTFGWTDLVIDHEPRGYFATWPSYVALHDAAVVNATVLSTVQAHEKLSRQNSKLRAFGQIYGVSTAVLDKAGAVQDKMVEEYTKLIGLSKPDLKSTCAGLVRQAWNERKPEVEQKIYHELETKVEGPRPTLAEAFRQMRGKFNIRGTATGRIDSTGPNKSNEPKTDRPVTAPKIMDYAEVEKRILEHMKEQTKEDLMRPLLHYAKFGTNPYGRPTEHGVPVLPRGRSPELNLDVKLPPEQAERFKRQYMAYFSSGIGCGKTNLFNEAMKRRVSTHDYNSAEAKIGVSHWLPSVGVAGTRRFTLLDQISIEVTQLKRLRGTVEGTTYIVTGAARDRVQAGTHYLSLNLGRRLGCKSCGGFVTLHTSWHQDVEVRYNCLCGNRQDRTFTLQALEVPKRFADTTALLVWLIGNVVPHLTEYEL